MMYLRSFVLSTAVLLIALGLATARSATAQQSFDPGAFTLMPDSGFPPTVAEELPIGLHFGAYVGPTVDDETEFFQGVTTHLHGSLDQPTSVYSLCFNFDYCTATKILQDFHAFAWKWEANYQPPGSPQTLIENNLRHCLRGWDVPPPVGLPCLDRRQAGSPEFLERTGQGQLPDQPEWERGDRAALPTAHQAAGSRRRRLDYGRRRGVRATRSGCARRDDSRGRLVLWADAVGDLGRRWPRLGQRDLRGLATRLPRRRSSEWPPAGLLGGTAQRNRFLRAVPIASKWHSTSSGSG